MTSRAWRGCPLEHGVQRLDQGEDRGLGQHADAMPTAVVDQRRAQPVPGELTTAFVDAGALTQRFEVADPGDRSDQDAGTDHVGAPAEIDVVAKAHDLVVEPAQGAEEVGRARPCRRPGPRTRRGSRRAAPGRARVVRRSGRGRPSCRRPCPPGGAAAGRSSSPAWDR